MIAYDAISNSAGGTGTQSWTHTPVGTPRGVIVWAFTIAGDDELAGATYGGVAMTEVSASPALLTTGEAGSCHCYVLGGSIPTGAQTVVVTASATTTAKIGVAVTVTAADDTEEVDSDLITNASVADPSVGLTFGGRSCFVAIGFYSGHDAPGGTTPNIGWTSRFEADAGTETLGVYTYDTVGTTDVSAGWTQTAEDAAAIAVAISEVIAAGGATNPGWAGGGWW